MLFIFILLFIPYAFLIKNSYSSRLFLWIKKDILPKIQSLKSWFIKKIYYQKIDSMKEINHPIDI